MAPCLKSEDFFPLLVVCKPKWNFIMGYSGSFCKFLAPKSIFSFRSMPFKILVEMRENGTKIK